jgi:hypothetical protein
MDMGIIKKSEDLTSHEVGKLHPWSNSRKSTNIIFNSYGGQCKDWFFTSNAVYGR